MSIFQCSKCGCAENTALTGGYHGPRFYPEKVKRWDFDPNGRYCSACWDGMWHGRFDRKYYPLGTMVTNHEGNLVPRTPTKEEPDGK